MMLTKICSQCKEELPVKEFRKQKSTKDGLQYECKTCMNIRAKLRYEEKQDVIIQQNTEWQLKNKDKHLEASKRHYDSPTGKIGRELNKRLDHLLGKNRESFFHLIGLTPSVLLVHLGATLPIGIKIEEYGDKWVVGFVNSVQEEDLKRESEQRTALNWKNLTARIKETEKSLDLEVARVS